MGIGSIIASHMGTVGARWHICHTRFLAQLIGRRPEISGCRLANYHSMYCSFSCTGNQHGRGSSRNPQVHIREHYGVPPNQAQRSSQSSSNLFGRPPKLNDSAGEKARLRHATVWMPVSRLCMQMHHWSLVHSAFSCVIYLLLNANNKAYKDVQYIEYLRRRETMRRCKGICTHSLEIYCASNHALAVHIST